jgi:ABC-2 type transport system ATP-binding protein
MPLFGGSRPSSAVAEESRSNHDLPTDTPPLEVLNISKQYQGGLWANRGISLTGNRGEILGILGPNGAGKTTLVRQITTELLPTDGTIRILGHDVVREPNKVKSLLGVVPQATPLFHYLTVQQHLRIFAKLRGIPPRESKRRADQLVLDLELFDYRDVVVEKLSGGLMRRVMVGIAAIAEPPVMVLDEPTTGLDPQSRRNLWSVLRRYRERGAFVLLTTHSMEEAEVLCDRVGILRESRLLALDTVANLRENYGFQLKITYFPNGPNMDGATLYGADDQELVAKVRDMGYQNFSVGQTSLEDIYLAMIGGVEGFDDSAP